MKNICFINTTKFWGGGEKLHLENAIGFINSGYKVIIGTSARSALQKKCVKLNIPFFNLSFSNLSFLNPFKIAKTVLLFKKHKIDTVFFITSQDMKSGGLAAKLAGVKNIIYMRGLAVPIKNNFFNRNLFNKIITHPIANSLETKRTMTRFLGKKINADKIKVIYHGINLDLFKPSEQTKIPENKKIIIGNAGRLTLQKGQLNFIEIAKFLLEKNIDFEIRIVGTGELYTNLQNEIKKHKLENYIKLHGFVNDINDFLNNIDIFALTSYWEGFGFAIAEAMAMKKPVVAYDISSNPEIIDNNSTGFLIKNFDNKMFAEKLAELIENKQLRQEMGEVARIKAEKCFDQKKIIKQIENHINNN